MVGCYIGPCLDYGQQTPLYHVCILYITNKDNTHSLSSSLYLIFFSYLCKNYSTTCSTGLDCMLDSFIGFVCIQTFFIYILRGSPIMGQDSGEFIQEFVGAERGGKD